jgi:hypothetical protein
VRLRFGCRVMPHRIRIADPAADRALLTELLTVNLGPPAGRRFDWLYFENPHGPARAWVATEIDTGRAVGAAAAFPKKLLISGGTCSGYVLGDFCIDHGNRALGLALQLQRACLRQLASPTAVMSYDFPSTQMMAVYRRLQIAPLAEAVRWSKPLRADRQIGKLFNVGPLAPALAAPINQILAWKDSRGKHDGECSISEQVEDCGEEFTQLAQKIGCRFGTCVERSAAYLNWRFLHHPLCRHEMLVARRGAELLGYVVFSQTEADAKIVDLFGLGDTSMWNSLMSELIRRLRIRQVIAISAPLLAPKFWTDLLKRWGFRARETAPVVVCGSGKAGAPASSESAEPGWFLMDGDRES